MSAAHPPPADHPGPGPAAVLRVPKPEVRSPPGPLVLRSFAICTPRPGASGPCPVPVTPEAAVTLSRELELRDRAAVT